MVYTKRLPLLLCEIINDLPPNIFNFISILSISNPIDEYRFFHTWQLLIITKTNLNCKTTFTLSDYIIVYYRPTILTRNVTF